jgi:hypothetical protein
MSETPAGGHRGFWDRRGPGERPVLSQSPYERVKRASVHRLDSLQDSADCLGSLQDAKLLKRGYPIVEADFLSDLAILNP